MSTNPCGNEKDFGLPKNIRTDLMYIVEFEIGIIETFSRYFNKKASLVAHVLTIGVSVTFRLASIWHASEGRQIKTQTEQPLDHGNGI